MVTIVRDYREYGVGLSKSFGVERLNANFFTPGGRGYASSFLIGMGGSASLSLRSPR